MLAALWKLERTRKSIQMVFREKLKQLKEDIKMESSRSEPRSNSRSEAAPEAIQEKPTVRMVPERDQAPNGATNALDGDDVAPALALMNINERADSALGSDGESPTSSAVQHSLRHDRRVPQRGSAAGQRPMDDAARKLGVENVLDLNDSEDTTYHTKQAPAVVHETIVQDVHEIQHEVFERDIHEHEFYHRILPVQEIEVLPARHFVDDGSGMRREVPAEAIPGRYPGTADRILAEAFKKTLPAQDRSTGPRSFTARKFSGAEGDYRESVGPTGVVRSDQWWVHPPQLRQSRTPDEDAYLVHFD